jgi:putative transposase
LKNRVLLEKYYLPGDLEVQTTPSSITATAIATTRHRQSDTDVYVGRGNTILLQRHKIKRQTIQSRRLMLTRKAASPVQQMRQILSSK